MTRTDSRYERLDDIERKLARQPEGWTTGDLAREFGVDADTSRRSPTRPPRTARPNNAPASCPRTSSHAPTAAIGAEGA